MEASLNFLTIQAYLFNYAAKNEGAGQTREKHVAFAARSTWGQALALLAHHMCDPGQVKELPMASVTHL